MTIAEGTNGNKTARGKRVLMKDVLAALEAAGVDDPTVAQQVADSLSKVNRDGNANNQTRMPKQAIEPFADAVASDLEPEISDNARVVLEKRYFLKDSKGNIIEHSWSDVCRRVARAIAETETLYNPQADVAYWEEEYYRVMVSLEYVPNSPTLMNAGTGAGTLSACFVIGLEDSMEGIMETAKEAALVQKFGGGTGFALSGIRPKGAPISTTHGRACGPVAVLRHLSSVSTLVTQGGKRDGANMAVMDVHHPDILDFITCKTQEGEIHNFNISVGASEEFMQAVEKGEDYNLRDPHSGQVVGSLSAAEVFDHMIEGAWLNGEPGTIFLDRVNQDNPTLHLGRMTATNPCGEQPLLPYESCNLGSINLSKFVVEANGQFTLDWDRLGHVVRIATRFLDNVIDANRYSVAEIERMTKQTRKTGLGVMGFADMLVGMDIPYNSQEGLDLGREVMRFIRQEADDISEQLAGERGVFPAYQGSTYQKQGRLMRNACRLTVAPTGTISMIAGCSSGIEPLFSLSYHKHNILEGESLLYVDHNFEQVAREGDFYSDELMEYLANGGSIQNRDDVPEWVKEVFVTAEDISPRDHVRMQAVFQESVDAAISKTINFPNFATRDDVRTAYLLAWELGCKGITVYRSGSREEEVLTSGATGKAALETAEEGLTDMVTINNDQAQSVLPMPMARPSQVLGVTDRVRTGHGNMYITINSRDGHPFEVFSNLGKAGGCDSAQLEAISRLVSLALRSGINPDQVTEQLRGITCCPQWDDGTLVRSAPDAVALVLSRHIQAPSDPLTLSLSKGHDEPFGEAQGRPFAVQQGLFLKAEANGNGVVGKAKCPDCEGFLVHQEGCEMCPACGYNRCG
ncbi:MAG: vitamin B12-dependent ribonucleotide reductase [Chloroflexi bacterium]|nr:vitamin B12-dependent ribonucleotide reductase [Chloroflexota bacterium]